MKSGKKRTKLKPQKHLLKKRLIYIFLAISASILICFLVYAALNPQNSSPIDETPKAAIVDHLSTQWPNQIFPQTIQAILNETGLEVDYYSSEQVTVDLYRKLPTHNYKLILFRVHSTGECSVEGQPPFVVFFTSEEYNNMKHIPDQLATRVVYVNFPDGEPPGYFGITPLFTRDSMNGRFNDTIIIAMGCDGLKHTSMAEAFIDRGAKAYISWNGLVSAGHTDKATTYLVRQLVEEKKAIEKAVTETMKEVGPDPTDESILLFYPETAEAGDYIIPYNINKAETLNNTQIHTKPSERKRVYSLPNCSR